LMVGESCKYCGYPIEYEPDAEHRKKFPQAIHTRMSHGAEQDEEGRWYHLFVWQCMRAHEEANP
jgi:hypothetical protein